MFEAKQIRKLLEVAPPQMNAMILLGINCGLGNNDCGSLQQKLKCFSGNETIHVWIKRRSPGLAMTG